MPQRYSYIRWSSDCQEKGGRTEPSSITEPNVVDSVEIIKT